MLARAATIVIMRRAAGEGRLRYHRNFASKFLSTKRDLIVYVPPGYDGASRARYPVLYLQDGQNLFDPATAFGGNDWQADITADRLIEAGAIRPLIIVGIYNTGVRRISEYTPTRDPRFNKGGKADRYAQMLAREVKPFIDSEYRTVKSAWNTGIGGSSLGALTALHAGMCFPAVFGMLALMSPSVWWDSRAVLPIVSGFRATSRPKIWLDIGSEEGNNPARVVDDTRLLRDALVDKGWREEENLCYREFEGAGHNEGAWAYRFGMVLEWLYGRVSDGPSQDGPS
jgi:predicted alpha/beta superfamily hydrolase